MTIFEIYYSAMERAFGDYPSTSKKTRKPSITAPPSAGIFFASVYQKPPRFSWWLIHILPLILQAFTAVLFYLLTRCSYATTKISSCFSKTKVDKDRIILENLFEKGFQDFLFSFFHYLNFILPLSF